VKFAKATCADNIELLTVVVRKTHDVDYEFTHTSCESEDIAVFFSYDTLSGAMKNAGSLKDYAQYSQPLGVSDWKVSSQEASTIALSKYSESSLGPLDLMVLQRMNGRLFWEVSFGLGEGWEVDIDAKTGSLFDKHYHKDSV
jgi:uncharacterized membrane protein YkoI